jgi:hypothetical protein
MKQTMVDAMRWIVVDRGGRLERAACPAACGDMESVVTVARRVCKLLCAVPVTAALCGCDMLSSEIDARTRIDVYADHYEYRRSRYESVRALSIALEAANDAPEVIEVHDCEAESELESVLDAVRARGHYNIAIVMPRGC